VKEIFFSRNYKIKEKATLQLNRIMFKPAAPEMSTCQQICINEKGKRMITVLNFISVKLTSFRLFSETDYTVLKNYYGL